MSARSKKVLASTQMRQKHPANHTLLGLDRIWAQTGLFQVKGVMANRITDMCNENGLLLERVLLNYQYIDSTLGLVSPPFHGTKSCHRVQ
jgi:hypothetical protein